MRERDRQTYKQTNRQTGTQTERDLINVLYVERISLERDQALRMWSKKTYSENDYENPTFSCMQKWSSLEGNGSL